jgi:hypothetical protein
MNDDRAEIAQGLRRLMRAYWTRRYAILFYTLLATMAAGPAFAALGIDARLLEVLLAASLLAAVMPVSAGMVARPLLLAALAIVCVLRFGALWIDDATMSTASLALWSLIALFAAVEAVRFAVRARAVDREHLYAALDAYLLFGIFLGVLYWTIECAFPGSFVASNPASAGAHSLSQSIYFSFVTLVTLGYGDIVPRSDAARGLAVVEAVTGQLYLTVMIAHLVSLHVRARLADEE